MTGLKMQDGDLTFEVLLCGADEVFIQSTVGEPMVTNV